jgi:hypothetical protein
VTDHKSTKWPMRHRERPDIITGAPKGSLAQDKLVLELLKQIQECEIASRPSGGAATAKNKDMAAFEALGLAAWLVEYTAGWAICHQIGLALDGSKFVPLGPKQTRNHPEYLVSKKKADSHRHERNGGVLTLKEIDPLTARCAFINILMPMAGKLHLPASTLEALRALDYGDTGPILKTATPSRRTGLVALELKLIAIAFIEYEHRKGTKKLKSQKLVAEKFGMITHDAVRDWNVELRNALGSLTVDRELDFARNCGASHKSDKLKGIAGVDARNADFFEERYGLPALERAADRWRKLKKKK